MGAVALRSPESTPAPAPVFYTKEFIESYSAEAAETSAAQDRLAAAVVPEQTVGEADLKECSGEFEVANFPVTCATTKTVSEGKQDCREIVSGPILVAKQYTFGIAVAWSVKPDGTVEESKNLGVHVKRLDDNPEELRRIGPSIGLA
eukprot:g11929.t1